MDGTTSTRRLLLLTAMAVILGVVGGVAAWLLLHLIGLITNLALFHTFAWDVPSFSELVVGPHIIVVAVLGATAVSLIAKWSPVIRGHGIPETMEAVLVKQSRVSPRTALTKPTASAIAIGTAASASTSRERLSVTRARIRCSSAIASARRLSAFAWATRVSASA